VKRNILRGVLLGVLCVASVAMAQEEGQASYGRGQGWSVLSGQTMGQGGTAFVGQVGWPGISLGLLHGATPKFDIGGRFTFNYGREGIVTSVVPGLKLQAWVRLMLLQSSRVNVGLSFAPGPFFYFYNNGTDVGLTLPIALTVGIPVGSAVMLNLGMDIPFYVIFGTGGGPVFPILFGGGLEYFISRDLAVNFNVRMGPSIFPNDDFIRYRGRQARFTMEALFGLAYKF
jgi:hypothetical protein